MSVMLVLIGAAAGALVVALFRGRSVGDSWPLTLRVGLAVMFTLTGTTHFVFLREELITMVPPALPAPELLVTLTGVLELVGALGLLLPRTTTWAASVLALMLLAMFPANIYAATSGVLLDAGPATALGPRTAMQALYLAAAIAVAFNYRDRAWPRADGPAPSVTPRRDPDGDSGREGFDARGDRLQESLDTTTSPTHPQR